MKTLITCHANADCDAFSAMLAAAKLYDSADLLFPGTQEAGLLKLYASMDKAEFNFVDASTINFADYDRLVVVDTRQPGRLRHVHQLLERDNVQLEVWDHHPPMSEDLKPQILYYRQTGAVTTLLCEELKKRNISLSPREATLLGLGIYGDTGSFSYSSTTHAEFEMAAWLLDQGMDINEITDMASHALTGLHVQALNSLLESAQPYTIGDAKVVLAEARMEDYLGDFAYLAHQMMEMEKFEVLFAIGIMGDRIQISARSRNPAINVGEVCAALGGGGHAYAASACVRDKMITAVRETILNSLERQVVPQKVASDYMSFPPIGVATGQSIRQADELMLHFGLKAVPVFKAGTRECVGLLEAQIAARAAAHGLGVEPVEEYMQRRITTLPPDASLQRISDIIVGERQRLVPIVENDEVIGVVTRTDLINVFANQSGILSDKAVEKSRKKNVARQLNAIDKESLRILKLAGELGQSQGTPVYAVGGFVRDLLIGRPNNDIDLVAEHNGLEFAAELARALGGRVRQHEKFLTAVVIYHDHSGNERRVDVATARLEYYQYPAALPTVELSSLKMDLFRRDFSINALAIRLDGEHYGTLEDFFGGARDIRDKLIRVLHTLSFVEDPTRCIRAVRFEQRYKFSLGQGTRKLMANMLAMKLLNRLSPQRLFAEICHVCEEETAAACFMRMDELGILSALSPSLALNPGRRAILERTAEILNWYRLLYFDESIENWICYFLSLANGANYATASEIYSSLGLPENRKNEIMHQRERLREISSRFREWQKDYDRGAARVSKVCELLAPFSVEVLLHFMASIGHAGLKKTISRYLTQWRNEKADINGKDLMGLGIEAGPEIGRLLRFALNAKLDGRASGARQQLALAAREYKSRQDN